ncbi:MAG: YhdT family protein [Clostridiales bacterium]|nr:YhdT family protein [Clostridiales bacterium]MDD7347510.1 YhdT family protein [Clostridiales bacterium]MDY4061256.1 YhdT family protein [Anaerovoracaceae bacterium]
MSERDRNRQIKKEAAISLALYAIFFLWWYFTGYGIAERGTPESYTYVWGLPLWFFLSCILGYVLFCVSTILVVKIFFKDMSLDDLEDSEQ